MPDVNEKGIRRAFFSATEYLMVSVSWNILKFDVKYSWQLLEPVVFPYRSCKRNCAQTNVRTFHMKYNFCCIDKCLSMVTDNLLLYFVIWTFWGPHNSLDFIFIYYKESWMCVWYAYFIFGQAASFMISIKHKPCWAIWVFFSVQYRKKVIICGYFVPFFKIWGRY